MTLTNRQFEKLRHSCLHKFSFRTLPHALAHMAILHVRNLAHPNPPKHWRKNFDAYECEFCGLYHIGHKGLEESARAFKVKHRQIVVSRSLYVQPVRAKN